MMTDNLLLHNQRKMIFKKSFILTLFLYVFCFSSFAQTAKPATLFKIDSAPIKVYGLKIQGDKITYRLLPSTKAKIYSIAQSQCLKVIYDNGKEMIFEKPEIVSKPPVTIKKDTLKPIAISQKTEPKPQFPDRIYKKEKSVIDCKIISITNQEVKFILITDDSKQVRTLSRSEIERIDYNGEKEKIAPNVAKENEIKSRISNRIYKKDRSIIDCKITAMNEKEVQYIVVTDDSRKVMVIKRKYVDRIEQTDDFGNTSEVVKSEQKNVNPIKGKSIKERLTASVLLGITGSLPFGREIDTLRNMANAQKISSDSVNQFDRGINPLISFHIGLLAKLQLRPKLYLSSGLIYGRRGFSQFNQFKYRNPIYQYDQLLVNKARYQLDIIELPVCLHWTLSKKLALETGIGLAFQIGSAEQIVTTNYEVTINGKKNPDESVDALPDTYSLKDVSSSIIPSAQISVIYQVREKWSVRFNTQYTHNLFNTGSHIKNGVLNVGISYTLF